MNNEIPLDVVEAVESTKPVPYCRPATKEISRKDAQRRAVNIFGPRAFCRKHTKTIPALRFEIGYRKTVPPFQVVSLAFGSSWKEATENAVIAAEARPEVLE